jgi:hypothetical protein
MLDLRVWSGDSGAAVRNRWGDVVGVISILYTMDAGHGQLTLACAIPLRFTDDEWREATK